MKQDPIDPGTHWDRPVLIGCCPSSGSTLLSVILDTHPQIFCGPELALFSHPFLWAERGERWRERMLRYTDPAVEPMSQPDWTLEEGVCPWISFSHPANFSWYGCEQEGIRARVPQWNDAGDLVDFLFRRKCAETGKSLWVEKTPSNLYGMSAFLERYPGGRGIVVLRDGRDVVCSLMKRGFGFARAAAIWVLEAAMTLALSKHARVHLVRYEDLVADPRETLRRVMDFLQIETKIDDLLAFQNSRRAREDATVRLPSWKNSPKDAISASSVGRWQDELSELHVFVMENLRLKQGFPGLEALAGMSGRDILGAAGYRVVDPIQLEVNRFGAWLAEEKTTLLSLVDKDTFHYRYVSLDLGAAEPTAWVLLPFLAGLARDVVRLDTYCAALSNELAETKADLANTRLRLEHANKELVMRLGLRNGVKETLRSAWRLIRQRPAG